ncbi:polysaccharide biosynthesis tyrosine autokinase [Nostocales cyanobacterium LEGE 12452]|nr:polysaccharide biosynthesis tyrosine autokinase [Nostocales cyanobacterium LEGE 12452]
MDSREPEEIDFQKGWLMLKRRWRSAASIFGVVIMITAFAVLKKEPSYTASGKLLLKLDATPSLTGIKTKEDGGSSFVPLSSTGNPLNTEAEVILSDPLIRKTVGELNLKDKQGKLRSETEVKKRLQVKNVAGADVMQISYTGSDPQESAAIVNKLLSIYIRNNISNNRLQAVAAGKFIFSQLPEAEAAVNQAEAALRKFKEINQVVDLSQEATSTVTDIKDLENRITQTQAELAELNKYYQVLQNQIQNQLGMSVRDALAASALSQSVGVQDILKKFQQVQSDLAVQQTRLSDEHPTIVSLKMQEAKLKRLLEERVRAVITPQQPIPKGNFQFEEPQQILLEELVKTQAKTLSLSSRLSSLNNAKSGYRRRATILPKLEKDQRQLQRKLDAAQSTYQLLLQKLQEVRVVENQDIGNARIIEAASVPRSPSDISKRVIFLGLGGLVGALLGIATVFVLESTDKSIKTIKETRKIFDYTLLGVIPYFEGFAKDNSRNGDTERTALKVYVRDNPRSFVSEVYSMIQANLKFLSSDKDMKVIVVTSSVPQEGKSTVAANLATAMAQIGRRVLLVDADMRHPSQHIAWDLTNEVGLSNAIVSRDEPRVVVKEVMSNLDVLCSGVIPPNPLALLDSNRMASLIKEFSDKYDFIIIDTPPLMLAADALILGKMADGILLVSRPGLINATSAHTAKEALHRSDVNILGLVINGVLPRNEPNSYFYYSNRYSMKEDFQLNQKSFFKTSDSIN